MTKIIRKHWTKGLAFFVATLMTLLVIPFNAFATVDPVTGVNPPIATDPPAEGNDTSPPLTPPLYDITLDGNGGFWGESSTNTAKTQENGTLDPTTMPAEKPFNEGYTFVSWTLSDGTIVDENYVFTDNTTIYADWLSFSFEPTSLMMARTYSAPDNPAPVPTNGSTTDGQIPGTLTLNKTADWLDYDNGIAWIDFEVSGVPIKSGSDVIIILDQSGSMGPGSNSNYYNIDDEVKSVVKDFANDLLGNSNLENNRVALIPFNTSTPNSFNFVNDINTFNTKFTAVDNYIPKNATHYNTAFAKAQTYIDSVATDGRPIHIVFFSDGDPNPLSNNGQTYAETMKNNGITIHTIGYQRADSSYMTALASTINNQTSYVNVTNINNLADVYATVAENIKLAAYDATIVDPMSQYFTLYDDSTLTTPPVGYSTGSSIDLTANDDKISFFIGDVTETAKKYRILVELKDEYKNVQGTYLTNDQATLEYTDPADTTSSKDFPQPDVTVLGGSIDVKYYLVDEDGKYTELDGTVIDNQAIYENALVSSSKYYTDLDTENKPIEILKLNTPYSIPANFNVPDGYVLVPNQENVQITLNRTTSSAVAEFKVVKDIPKVTVTYTPGEGGYTDTVNGTNITMEIDSGSDHTVLGYPNTFTPPEGKEFSHWVLAGDDLGTEYDPTDVIENITQNITLIAQYKYKVYTVTFFNDDGTTVLKANQNIIYNTAWNSVWKPATTPTTTMTNTDMFEYTFLGYYEKGDSNQTIVSTFPTNVTRNLTYIAKYSTEYRTFTVTFVVESENGTPLGTLTEGTNVNVDTITRTVDYGTVINTIVGPTVNVTDPVNDYFTGEWKLIEPAGYMESTVTKNITLEAQIDPKPDVIFKGFNTVLNGNDAVELFDNTTHTHTVDLVNDDYTLLFLDENEWLQATASVSGLNVNTYNIPTPTLVAGEYKVMKGEEDVTDKVKVGFDDLGILQITPSFMIVYEDGVDNEIINTAPTDSRYHTPGSTINLAANTFIRDTNLYTFLYWDIDMAIDGYTFPENFTSYTLIDGNYAVITAKAVWETLRINVTFKANTGGILTGLAAGETEKTYSVSKGQTWAQLALTYPGTQANEGFYFTGWTYTYDGNAITIDAIKGMEQLNKNIVATANFAEKEDLSTAVTLPDQYVDYNTFEQFYDLPILTTDFDGDGENDNMTGVMIDDMYVVLYINPSSGTDVGEYPLRATGIEYSIFNSDGTDVSEMYAEPTFDLGSLFIEQLDVSVTIEDDYKMFGSSDPTFVMPVFAATTKYSQAVIAEINDKLTANSNKVIRLNEANMDRTTPEEDVKYGADGDPTAYVNVLVLDKTVTGDKNIAITVNPGDFTIAEAELDFDYLEVSALDQEEYYNGAVQSYSKDVLATLDENSIKGGETVTIWYQYGDLIDNGAWTLEPPSRKDVGTTSFNVRATAANHSAAYYYGVDQSGVDFTIMTLTMVARINDDGKLYGLSDVDTDPQGYMGFNRDTNGNINLFNASVVGAGEPVYEPTTVTDDDQALVNEKFNYLIIDRIPEDRTLPLPEEDVKFNAGVEAYNEVLVAMYDEYDEEFEPQALRAILNEYVTQVIYIYGNDDMPNIKISIHAGDFTINQRDVTITANDDTKVQGTTDPVNFAGVTKEISDLTFVPTPTTGLINGDMFNFTVERIPGFISDTQGRNVDVLAPMYDPTDLTGVIGIATNYNFIYENGDLTVLLPQPIFDVNVQIVNQVNGDVLSGPTFVSSNIAGAAYNIPDAFIVAPAGYTFVSMNAAQDGTIPQGGLLVTVFVTPTTNPINETTGPDEEDIPDETVPLVVPETTNILAETDEEIIDDDVPLAVPITNDGDNGNITSYFTITAITALLGFFLVRFTMKKREE